MVMNGRFTDLADPLVAEHYANSMTLFGRMAAMAKDQGVPFLVLFVPSKQRVYHRLAERDGITLPKWVVDPAVSEDKLIERYRSFFSAQGIAAADAVDPMAELLEENIGKGEDTYLPGDDHPLEAGYLAYAEAALSRSQRIAASAHPSR
jgi:hypothetical protein